MRVVQMLERVSQPYLTTELQCSERLGNGCPWLDGDLTGIPVSNTSQAYPHAAFGRMDDAIWLGYQASVVSLESPIFNESHLIAQPLR